MDPRSPLLFKFTFIPISYLDLLDILLTAIVIYFLLTFLLRLPIRPVLYGFLFLFLSWVLVKIFNLQLLSLLLQYLLLFSIFMVVVLFASEFKRAVRNSLKITWLEQILNRHSFGLRDFDHFARELLTALQKMAMTNTGALIVLVNRDPIDAFITSGNRMNAEVTSDLLLTIFNKSSVYHDGAVLIKDGMITAVRCVLPISDDPDLPAELGLRHRAGLGISEVSDSAAIIVSEETGSISIAYDGKLKRNVSEDEILHFLHKFYASEEA
jgi:uncharacterized protein (TIGR00159 family)